MKTKDKEWARRQGRRDGADGDHTDSSELCDSRHTNCDTVTVPLTVNRRKRSLNKTPNFCVTE